jgi:GNAT superfamily N-acetyltransferase
VSDTGVGSVTDIPQPLEISRVTETDLQDLLPLVRAYCDFYAVAPEDGALLAVSQALIADPEHEGVQLIARGETGEAVGFATLYWSWNTLIAAQIGIMHDLFVAPEARGSGVPDALIEACVRECRQHGAAELAWQTATDNLRAQRVYDRVGASRAEWVDYSLNVRS